MSEEERRKNLERAKIEAWSYPGAQKPKGEYIGSIKDKSGVMFHYYKDGERFWFDTDFCIYMREKDRKEKKERYQEERRLNSANRFHYASGRTFNY